MLLTDPGVSTTMVATGTEGDSHPEAGTVKDAGNNGGGRGTQKAEKTGKELENAKEKQQQLPPVVASSSSIDALALTASPSTTKPTVHCLFCQAKLELHPSLVTEGGEIAPLSNEIPASEPSSTGLANLAEPCSSDIQSFIADLQLNQDPENSNIASSSSLLTPMSPNQNGNMNLLELIGQSNSPLDVPMCKKCATSVATELQQQLADLERECRQYKQALDQQLKHRLDSPFDQDLARRKLETLKTEERDLQDQLAFLEEEERTLNRELDVKMEERRRISEQDEQLYRQLRDNHRTLIEQADEQRALKLQIRHAEEQIKQLSRTNVLDMCFHIWVDGEFGTISGFRLGRLRHEPIEWNEINAALGQMAFLLKVISERLGMEFIGAELVPCGNCSFIRVQKVYSQQQSSSSSSNGNSRVEEWPLYGSGGWRPFGQPGLDKALVAFMDCFLQIEHCLKQYFPAGTQLLPYRMLKDKIVDKDSQYLVKMQLNSEERWTKAMKCLLLNLKRVIGILSTLPSLTAQPHQQSQSPRSTTTPIGGESAAGKGSSSSSSPSISIKSIGMAEKQLQK